MQPSRSVSLQAEAIREEDLDGSELMSKPEIISCLPRPRPLACRHVYVSASLARTARVDVAGPQKGTLMDANGQEHVHKPGAERSASSDAHSVLIELVYRLVLGREPQLDDLAQRVAGLDGGISFADMFVEIAASEEAASRAREMQRMKALAEKPPAPRIVDDETLALWTKTISFAYRFLLKRKPGDHEYTLWLDSLRNGLTVERFLEDVASCEEARIKGVADALGGDLSDGEFLMTAGSLLQGRGLTPAEIVSWQKVLDEDPEKRRQFVFDMIHAHITATTLADAEGQFRQDPTSCFIMGTQRCLTRDQWVEQGNRLTLGNRNRKEGRPQANHSFIHTGEYKVSMIASLYMGGEFISDFLENITSQSLFDRAELIIIDANSPQHERAVIERYQKVYPNIVYKRIEYRIGIYEAWNLAVELARSCYLTNTNLDDLRRGDSIALQAKLLDEQIDVDVVYQDFYYSFDPNLDFDEITTYGFKSELPIICPHNLLLFNSPHNAPMWRKSLHEQLGYFDTHYRSAGDYEFWARCLANGKKFRKINSPHVAYYQNPRGVSTSPDSQGAKEAHEILSLYSSRLTSPTLLQSRLDFHANLGVEARVADDRSYYNVAQDALRNLGRYRASDETPAFITHYDRG